MPSVTPLRRIGSSFSACTIDVRELPVAALICDVDGLRCVAANERLGQAVGHRWMDLSGRALGEIMAEPDGRDGLSGCLAVRLRKSDGGTIAATMLALPAALAGRRRVLCAFLLPDSACQWRNADLAAAIDGVIREEMGWFSGAVMQRLAHMRSRAPQHAGLDQLTPRESQILELICAGHADAEIATRLAISRNTLRNHLANIYGKIGVRRRSDAVLWGCERGMAAF